MTLNRDKIIEAQIKAAKEGFHQADEAELDIEKCWKSAMEAALDALLGELPEVKKRSIINQHYYHAKLYTELKNLKGNK